MMIQVIIKKPNLFNILLSNPLHRVLCLSLPTTADHLQATLQPICNFSISAISIVIQNKILK